LEQKPVTLNSLRQKVWFLVVLEGMLVGMRGRVLGEGYLSLKAQNWLFITDQTISSDAIFAEEFGGYRGGSGGCVVGCWAQSEPGENITNIFSVGGLAAR
jgi:hypothetical protein